MQTAYTMLYVAKTTESELTKARCLAKVQAMGDRLIAWIKRYPYLRDLRGDLDDLLRQLPRGS